MASNVLYVLRADGWLIKLGTGICANTRRGEIARQLCLDDLEVVYSSEPFSSTYASLYESKALHTLSLSGRQACSEWFYATPEQAIDAIRIAFRQGRGQELQLRGPFRRKATMRKSEGAKERKPR